jgi:gliding motility-associated-like protein
VEVNPTPDSFNSSLFQCDEDGFVDGFTIFNCHETDDVLTGNITGLSTAFYLTMADAQSSSNPINGSNFPNTSNPQTLYVQVIDDASGCFSISQLELEVSTTDVSDALLVRCDDDGTEDGLASFDLTQADSMVLVSAPTGVTITYYASNQDALLEQNPLTSPFVNTSPYSQNIYARAEDDNACYGISQVLLQVNPLPILQDDQTIIYCLNTFPTAINLNAGVIGGGSGLSYSWNTGEATEDIQVNQAGVYRVTVENANGCSQQRQITVVASDTATIENIVVTDASEQNAIAVFVSGVGNYEFALDNPLGNYQNIGFFDQVSPGIHTVYVRDINGCGITQEMVSVIGFMKFFTPNGDGFNDTWQVIGLSSQFQPDSKIIIYDRYGKLITLITPEHSGWDGTYNGYKMPASDYWFHAILQDGRSFKGHFTLKR